MTPIRGAVAVALVLWLSALGPHLLGQTESSSAPRDENLVEAVARQGHDAAMLEDSPLATLAGVLLRFGVPIDSQLLVFSKTSLQVSRISTTTPRALYFNDDVTVGYVQGGDLEVATFDPQYGVALYTRAMTGTSRPFERHSGECASCHGVTRLLLQSVTPARDGNPLLAFTGSEVPVNVDYRTPFEQRWGGWYVTGTHGAMRHRGNAVAPDPLRPYDLDLSANGNWTTLPGTINRAAYLTDTSDIVALMTYEHQVVVANALARLNVLARRAPLESPDVLAAIDATAALLLFTGEAALPAPVQGTGSFARSFAARGPVDRSGRSLRQFNLNDRLFAHRLSYMVYSTAFKALPSNVRHAVLVRVLTAITMPAGAPATWPEGERRAVLEIVRDTVPDLPAEWTAASSSVP